MVFFILKIWCFYSENRTRSVYVPEDIFGVKLLNQALSDLLVTDSSEKVAHYPSSVEGFPCTCPGGLQGYLARKKPPPPIGPLQGTRHRPTAGSWGGVVSCKRGGRVSRRTRPSPHDLVTLLPRFDSFLNLPYRDIALLEGG